MRVLPVDQLEPGKTVSHPLYHPSGRLLIGPGWPLREAHLRSLRAAGLSEVVECPDEESEAADLRRSAGWRVVRPDADGAHHEPLHDAGGGLLAPAGAAIDRPRIETWDRLGIVALSGPPPRAHEIERFDNALVRLLTEDLDRRIEKRQGLRHPAVAARTAPLLDQRQDSTDGQRRSALDTRRALVGQVEDLHLAALRGAPSTAVAARIEAGLEAIDEALGEASNLQLALLPSATDRWLARHATAVALLARAMATQAGLGEADAAQLTAAGLLADLGMSGIPHRIVTRQGSLSPGEMREIRQHPLATLACLARLPALGDDVGLTAYQAHEREDGSGYPGRLRSGAIHDHARLLAVADMYVAMSSPRPYRAPYGRYEALETLVRLASQGVLHAGAVRTLLRTVSLYPLGSWVEINSGEIGRVIASGGEAIDRPLVRLLRDPSGQPLTEPMTVDLASEPAARIVATVDHPPDDDPLAGF